MPVSVTPRRAAPYAAERAPCAAAEIWRVAAIGSPETLEPHALHAALACFNEKRLRPSLADSDWSQDLDAEIEMRTLEAKFVDGERQAIAARAATAPDTPDAFIDWYEALKQTGPGQGDPLFPFLADAADLTQMRWFIRQEMGGEAGFEDLLALTQIRFPQTAKLELARNYWDEMGRGNAQGMHGPMLSEIGAVLGVAAVIEETVWEALALTNMMVALAANRRYAYQSIGALGAIEMTAPGRVALVDAGLERLGIAKKARHYFTLHSVLDIKHSESWNREILHSLVAADRAAARPIAEGALLRLRCGERTFARYRREFGLG